MPETIKAEKLYKFGKGKGQVKKEFTTTIDKNKNVIAHEIGRAHVRTPVTA